MSNANRLHYRAWNKYKKRMMRVSVLDILKDEVKVMKPSGEQMYRAWPLCDVVLLQSTGLIDSKGVEIFAGDFVSFMSDKRLVVIRWCNGGFGFWGMGGEKHNDFVGLSGHCYFGEMMKTSKVHGNVYESPSLLEQPHA